MPIPQSIQYQITEQLKNLLKILAILAIVFPLHCLAQPFVPGYHRAIAGEELQYHAPQPDANVSLLIRSEDEKRYIEWETDTVPGDIKGETVTFLMLAGIDVNPEDPHEWQLWVDDLPFFTIISPTDTLQKDMQCPGPDGSMLEFKASQVDRYGDFMGYLFLNLPKKFAAPGKSVKLKVTGDSAGSRTWFMVFKYEAIDKVTLSPEQAVQRGEKGEFQLLHAAIVHYADPVRVKTTIGDQVIRQSLDFGYNSLYLPVPRIKETTNIHVRIKAGKNVLANQDFTIEPVKQRTIYLLHHSHNDIGYTNVQPEVERMQWKNLDDALALSEKTKDYPEDARMKWCTEVMWAVDSYYEKLGPEKKAEFQKAVKAGSIELDGFYANELTGLCGAEELDQLLEAGRRISKECGVNLTSAMITDIPGWSWAIVPAMAKSGVKYLSLGTNRGHRIGDIIEKLGDKPFYWVSQTGMDSVLCWVHGAGYSLFHTGLDYKSIQKRLREDLVFGYLNELEESNYPYEEVMLRYNIGSDNGPVDMLLPDEVKAWNEKFVTPNVVISTVGEAFSEFEAKHGKEIPEIKGRYHRLLGRRGLFNRQGNYFEPGQCKQAYPGENIVDHAQSFQYPGRRIPQSMAECIAL